MELRQLKYFVTIAEELHYGNAAKKLFVSQPALSQQIQLLENEIGVELFIRKQRKHFRKVELTEVGEAFLADAKRILKLSQQAIENARKLGSQQKVVRIGTYKMLLRERIVELITLFSSHFPEIDIKIIELPTYLNVQEALLDDSIDLGLTLFPIKFEQIAAKNTQKGHLQLIMSEKHPLAEMTEIKLSSLKNEKWVEINKSLHPVYDAIEKCCQAAGFSRESHIVQEVSSLELLCSLVALNIGIAFVPSLYHAELRPVENFKGIVLKNLVNDDGTPFTSIEINHLVAYKNEKPSPLIEALVSLL